MVQALITQSSAYHSDKYSNGSRESYAKKVTFDLGY